MSQHDEIEHHVARSGWKALIGYGRRWKVECTFSDLKRLFGDVLRSRKKETNVEETIWKITVLKEYKEIRMKSGPSAGITEHSCS